MRLENGKKKGLKSNCCISILNHFEGSHAIQPTSFKPPLNPFKIFVDLTRNVPSHPTPAFVAFDAFLAL
jgi:hypothetical protein